MKPSSLFRNDIQGLRGLAVLAVILFHYNADWLPGGFVGVDVFLVISGYLITGILLRKKNSPDFGIASTLKLFYLSRIKRIVPAYYVMLLLVSFASAVLFMSQDFSHYRKSLEDALLFMSNEYFSGFGDYFAPTADELPLLHTWSLAVEMQFYLFFPFVVLLVPLHWLKKLLPALLIIIIVITEYALRVKGDQQAVYYSLFARIPEFLAGATISLYGLEHRTKAKTANFLWLSGLLIIIASAAIINSALYFPGLLSLVPVIGACLLITNGHSSYSRFLSYSPLVWLGALSYSLYLWHWPVLAFLRYYTGAQNLSEQYTFVFIVTTLVLSIASYYIVEARFYRATKQTVIKKNRLSPKTVVLYGMVVIVAALLSELTTKLNDSLSPPELVVQNLRYADPSTICHGSMLNDCWKGDIDSSHKILVLGDSHAAMLNHFFDYLGKELDFKAKIITASSCVTIPGFDYERLPSWAQKPCLTQIEAAQKNLQEAELIFIAGMWSYQTQSENFKVALRNFFEAATNQGKEVYILPQIRQLAVSPMRARHFQTLGLPIKVEHTEAASIANAVIRDIAEDFDNVTYLDFSSNDLFSDAPFYQNNLIYFDEDHLNENGSKLYGKIARDTFYLLRRQDKI